MSIRKKKHRGKVNVPMIMQMEALECGAASLTMILAYYKKWIPLEQVREDCGISRDGSNAANIMKAARNYGLQAKAYYYSIDSIKQTAHLPAIIHWNFNHFVVLCGFQKKKAVINDPARGMVKVEMEEFNHSFTGICMEFQPGEAFCTGGKPESVIQFAKRRLKNTKLLILFVMLTMVFHSFIALLTPVFERVFTDQLLTGQNSEWIPSFLFAFLGMTVISLIIGILNEIYLVKIKGKVAILSNAAFFRHILNLPMNFFSQRMAGDLAGRQKLNDSIAETLISKVAPIFINLILLIFYFFLMLRYSLLLTAVGISAILLNIIVAKIITTRRVQIARVKMRDEGKLNSTTVSGIDMIETIKAAGAENGYFEYWAGFQTRVNNAQVQEIKNQKFLGELPVLIQKLSHAAILSLGAWLIIQGRFTAGMLLSFQAFMNNFLLPVENLIDAGESIQEMRTSMERIDDVMRYKTDKNNIHIPLEKDKVYEKLGGMIELKNITFGYSRLAPPLIKNFSMTIHPGDKVAFVGSSGCGKSTIAKLIAGLYEPWEGEILFDGKKREEIPSEVFHGSLAVVDQDITIFEDTITQNIKLWDSQIEDYEIILAARDAQIHEDIMARPKGYQHLMKEGGKDFSGGQRQRFEIARVLALDPTIAVLDEATSALDAKTEYAVMNAVKERGITSIVVAHRLSTIRDCTEIIVLNQGEVVERGTHKQLYEKNGYYTKLITTE